MKFTTTQLYFDTYEGISLRDISAELAVYLGGIAIESGVCILAISHKECALALVEDPGDDYTELLDLARFSLSPAPTRPPGEADILDDPPAETYPPAVLVESLVIPIRNGGLGAGSWDRVLLFDSVGPKQRCLDVTVVGN